MKFNGKILLVGAAIIFVMALAFNAVAQECPQGVPSCKVVVMTPEEIQSLTGPNMVFDQATWASRSTMTGLTEAWKKKIETLI